MGISRSLVRLAVALLLVAPALAIAQKMDALTFDSIRQLPTAELADRLLGSRRAEGIRRHELYEHRRTPGEGHVIFYRDTTAVDRDVCAYSTTFAYLDPDGAPEPGTDPGRVPLFVISIADEELLAYAPGCRTVAGQGFAIVNPGVDRDGAIAALRNLAAARAAAAGSRSLPFALSCGDSGGGGACARGDRAILAAIPSEQAWLITGEDGAGSPDQPSIILGRRGESYWEVHIADFGTPRARVSLIWTAIAPR